MKKRVFRSGILVLALGAIHMIVSGQGQANPTDQASNGIEGVWFAVVTPVTCSKPHLPLPNAVSFRGLNMFSHDGSFTNEAAFPAAAPLRSSGLGGWQHTQANMYTTTFRFFRYQETVPGMVSFQVMRKVTITLALDGDTFSSFDEFQDYGADNNPLPPSVPPAPPTSGCNIETAFRVR
jgi:hypothetical protein